MKRERFEELLSDKLQEFSVTPPEGLFDRISASLDEIPAAAPVPVVRRRIPMWRYASAAAAVLLAIGISWVAIEHISEEPKAILATTQPVQPALAVPPAKVAEATTIQTTATEQESITDRLRTLFYEEIAEENEIAQLDILANGITPQTLLAYQQPENADTTKPQIEGPALEDAPRAKRKASQGDDVTEAWRRAMAEQYASECNGGIVASLYGGNGGVMGSGSLNERGLASLVSSNMMVNEVVDDILIAQPFRAPQEAKLKHSMPLSMGIGLSLPINNKLAFETGVVYNYLHSASNQEQTMSTYSKERHLHYIGIPVGLSYNLFSRNAFDLYAHSSFMLERGVSGRDLVLMDGKKTSETPIEFKGVQPSVDLSVGAMFTVGNIGLYAQPGLSYYFGTTSQPANYRTENPVSFSLRMGLKFLFGEGRK
ncbi:MAG: outer membrane beta-barrel protein [Tidjanibacter sp.]|nr:outer membrane beta-barrel protein [Tidjanibacter sp.]